jgi:hypothetical protein
VATRILCAKIVYSLVRILAWGPTPCIIARDLAHFSLDSILSKVISVSPLGKALAATIASTPIAILMSRTISTAFFVWPFCALVAIIISRALLTRTSLSLSPYSDTIFLCTVSTYNDFYCCVLDWERPRTTFSNPTICA